jgi:hypothetical protein
VAAPDQYLQPAAQNLHILVLRVRNNWDTQQDLVNLQYSLFIVKGECATACCESPSTTTLTVDSENFINNDQSRHSWMALVGAPCRRV